MNKSKLFVYLKFLISFGLLIVLLWIMRHDIGGIIDILKTSNKLFFVLAISIILPLTILLAYRLKLLMSGQNISLPMKDFVHLTFIGYFFNNFFPTAIGGDIAKAYYASKKANNKAAAYAAVLADRIVGVLACVSIAIIGIIFVGKDFNNNKIIWAVVIMAILLISAVFLLLNEGKIRYFIPGFVRKSVFTKLREKVSKLYGAINFYKHSTRLLIKAYILSVLMQAGTVLCIYFFVLCVGGQMHLLKLFLIIPLVWAVSMVPSLNGLGVREGAFVYFLKGEIGADSAFAVSLMWLGVIILFSIIGGVMHLLYPIKVKRGGEENDR
ncbi:MAG: flippase-like domain-containing protein [Candidatus Omnitrophica bacterium]|nr:flippase-like domain-containing protein [Candidatus Omnitrophota bacterium]MBU1852887.1 flippase-like domain-containing protein [Candidatus Omnitrophota bacterium]